MKESILACLPEDHPWAEHIHCFDELGSTNDLCKSLAFQGAPEGTIVIADCQTAGRGRMGRHFHSAKGVGLYFSLLLRPNCTPQNLMHLTCAVAAAAAQAVEDCCRLPCGIKWTNDLVYNGKKLGGILTELSLSASGTVSQAIVGIGINCAHSPEDFPEELRDMAASLTMAAGMPISREKLCAALILRLHGMAANLQSGREQMLHFYRQRCITLGQDISLLRGDSIRHGRALEVDEDGGLMVLFSDGRTETVTSGEVSIRGSYGYV